MKVRAGVLAHRVDVTSLLDKKGKRVNFVNIQYSHTVPSKGYRQSPIRTGGEYVLPHKVNSKYCVTAEEDGTILDINDKILTVKYKSGKEVGYPIGTQYGSMEGSTYTHELITDLKPGSKFKKEEAILFHRDFFERDWLDKTKLVMKTSTVCTVALTMNNEVFEDSSAVSKNFAAKVGTEIVKDRKFILNFSDNLVELLPEGTKVKPEDVLFMSLDETSDGGNLSEQTIAMLKNLASLAPSSKVDGTIDRIEVKYNGDKEDMSPTIKKVVNRLDRDIYERTKGTEYEVKNNKVTGEYRSNGKNLNLDTLELTIYIKVPLRCGIGDKLVFGNPMKSVIGEIYTYDIHSESGDEIEAMFSYQGVINRVLNSPIIAGTTNRLIKGVGKQVVEAYFEK